MAPGMPNWSQINLKLYNFYLWTSFSATPQHLSTPLPSAEKHLPQLLVNSVHSIVLADPDQEPDCPHSQVMVGLHSVGGGGAPQWFCSCSCSVILPVSPSIFSDSVAIVPNSSRITRQLRSISSCLCSY